MAMTKSEQFWYELRLEVAIGKLVERKKHARPAEKAMLNRVLNGMRYTYEQAGPIWEELDPYGWEADPP